MRRALHAARRAALHAHAAALPCQVQSRCSLAITGSIGAPGEASHAACWLHARRLSAAGASTSGDASVGGASAPAAGGEGQAAQTPTEAADAPAEAVKLTWPKRLTRAERGSYQLNAAELIEELEMSPELPEGAGPVYDLGTLLPHALEPDSAAFDAIQEALAANPELAAALEEPDKLVPPYAGARAILRWDLRVVLAAGPHTYHPANRKARCSVYLRDLQEQAGLSDDAVQHIARIAGSRYNPRTGELTLTSEQHAAREDNRRHVLAMLQALLDEGRRAFPAGAAGAAGAGAEASAATA